MSSSTPPGREVRSVERRWAVALLFLAPLIAEFLLGNLPITWLWTLVSLLPLYGAGALLIREVIRRAGWGWPSTVLLALAFGIFEETLVTGSLFNPNYAGLRLLDFGFLPAWGIGLWWTVFVLSLHAIWSISVPIALVEALARGQADRPWLRRIGLIITALVFLVAAWSIREWHGSEGSNGTTAQLGWSAVVIAFTVAGAAWWGRHGRGQQTGLPRSSSAPSPQMVGTTTFLSGSCFMVLAIVHDQIPLALNLAGMVGSHGVVAAALTVWSRRPGWSRRHGTAAAIGYLATYAWYSFVQTPSVGEVTALVDQVGNGIFALAAVVLAIAAYRRSAATSVT